MNSLSEVSDLASAALDRLDNTSELSYDKGISLLTARNDLFLAYLQHLVFVLAVQLSPDHALKDHEAAVLELVKGRVALEKVKPLQAKLKYQIEKLLSKASEADSGAPTNDEDIVNDPLSFRPNPEALISSRAIDGPQSDSGASEDEDTAKGPSDGIYRPPRVAATPYVEPGAKKSRQRPNSSHFLTEMATAVNDRTPYAEASTGLGATPSFSSNKARKLSDMLSYEEEHMTRLSMSKRDSKKRRDDEALVYGGGATSNARGKQAGGFDAEFGDLLGSIGREGRYDAMRGMKRALPSEGDGASRGKSSRTKGKFVEAIGRQEKRRRQ